MSEISYPNTCQSTSALMQLCVDVERSLHCSSQKESPMASYQTVTSSMFQGIGHDPVANELTVRMKNGKVYKYAGVNAEAFEAFANAESLGKHFAANIRGKFDHSVVDETQDSER